MIRSVKQGAWLVGLFALYYLWPLAGRSLWQPDETRYAEISREMLSGGDWVVPHLLGIRYFEKPVVGYWINNLGQWLFGHNLFGVRFGSVLSISLCALLVYWLSWQLWKQRRTALLATVIFLTFLLVYGIGSYAVLDPMITLWLTAAMCSFWLAMHAATASARVGGWLLLGVMCGLGFMTKGLLALAVPVVSVMPWVIQQKRWRALLVSGPLAVLAALIISLPWAGAIAQREPDFWHYFFWVEHIQRFAEQDAQHKAPFWYYLPVALAGSLPWLGLVPGALARAWRERRPGGESLYLLGWVVMPFVFFSIAKGKLPTYILPCFAPLAMLLARQAECLAHSAGRGLRVNGWINLIFGLAGSLVVVLLLAPWGIAGRPLFASGETHKVTLAVLALMSWALFGLLALNSGGRRWYWAALCPLGLALVMGQVIPQRIIDAKQPQPFIQSVTPLLQNSRYVLSNSVGVAAGLAFSLQRSDITLFDRKGELKYGLDYADAQQRFVAADQFADWLAQHRRQGDVAVMLLLSSDRDRQVQQLPAADSQVRRGRMVLLHYLRRP